MRIIISPAKKMTVDTDSFALTAPPQFLPEAQQLLSSLQTLSPRELQSLWKCGDTLAALNTERLRDMDLHAHLTPAIFSYEGIQYRYMAPRVFETEQFDYIREHLRILSGFYGLLCPFDGVTPYRLEMQAKLSVNGCRDLYHFWGSKPAAQLSSETDFVLNLASKEYSRAVEPHLPPTVRLLTCVFGERKGGRIVEAGTQCKMARGQMVRWLAECGCTKPEELKRFDQLGYRFSHSDSSYTHYIFIKGEF